jgi:hypothetical protein
MRDFDAMSSESTDASRLSITPDSMGFGERGSITSTTTTTTTQH